MNPQPPNDQRRMYSDLARIFPILSPPEEYELEAEDFRRAILEHARPLAHTLLDLARCLNPQATYLPADMRSLRLGQAFDAVIIGDSIDYMLNEAELRLAFQAAWEDPFFICVKL